MKPKKHQSPQFSWPALLAIAVGLWGLSGCQRYQPRPLTTIAVEQKLRPPPFDALCIQASQFRHPLLPAITLQPDEGLTADESAIFAVLINPALRSVRDQRGSAAAALLQAGLLPNPMLAYSSDFVTGGNTAGTFNAYGATLSWDVTSLISHSARKRSAEESAASVDLAVAWQEWQVAEAAKLAVFDLVSLRAQLDVLEQVDARLQENLAAVQRAASAGLLTAIDLAAAEAAARDARGAVLQARRDVEHQWVQLTRVIGLPADKRPRLREGLTLPSRFEPPEATMLAADLDDRIDLLALRRGYDSQEQTLRAAILDQFPKINLGLNGASDNTNVHSIGLVAAIDLPIFDRNQGVIAAERATRQRLFDEYVSRVFQGRGDITTAVLDLHALNGQIADAEAAVPNLQRLVNAYKQALDHGNADVLSYYVAWNNLAQKRVSVLRLQQQLADARVALELAAGRCFPDPGETKPPTRISESAPVEKQ